MPGLRKITLMETLLGLLVAASQVCADCPQFISGRQIGSVESTAINEASGIAASRENHRVLWVHNDSGDSARVFATNTAGDHLGIYYLSGAGATDWEDMAIGPGPVDGVDYLYLGDIGDNSSVRSYITVYRVAEPAVDPNQSPITTTLTGVDAIKLQYPDGARDAETLMVDPVTRDIYIISKRETYSRLYRAAYPQSTSQTTTMEYKCQLPWGWTTGGDISPDGSEIIVRGYLNASIWQRPADANLWEAFSEPQCPVSLISEPQGEAICFVSGFACGYLTVSEGNDQPIYYFGRILHGDFDYDCDVDMTDLGEFFVYWLNDECGAGDSCGYADFDRSGDIDFLDIAVFAENWLFGKL